MKNKKIIAIIGDSGSGKTETAKLLFEIYGIPRVITSTTRDIRRNEKDGVDYYFLSPEEFLVKEKIEYDCYDGKYYGTTKQAIEDLLDKYDVISIVITRKGFLELKKAYTNVVSIYIDTAKDVLVARLRARGDKEASIKNRIDNLRNIDISDYDFIINNSGTLKNLGHELKSASLDVPRELEN